MSVAGAAGLVAAWRGRSGAPQRPSAATRCIVLDVESTGLDPKADRLLAIAAVALHLPPPRSAASRKREENDRRLEGGQRDKDRQNDATIAASAASAAPGRPTIDLADSFDAVLRPDPGQREREGSRDGGAPSASAVGIDKDNILVHGIGVGAMRAGHDAAEVLRRFAQWAAGAPRLGFHVEFDRALIERAERRHLGAGGVADRRARSARGGLFGTFGRFGPLASLASLASFGREPPPLWLDIEALAVVAYPEVKARALDEWLAHFEIPCLERHQAIADALATAELLLRLWPRLVREGATDAASLVRLAAARRWLR